MKTARERAEELAKMAGWHGDAGATGRAFLDAAELAFKEHARDQRHICAKSVSALDAEYHSLSGTARVQAEDAADAMRTDAHAVVMNAPAPGE